MTGENERLLYEILNEIYPGKWVSEFKGIDGRKFRFDAANPTEKIAIEIEGGIWMGGKGGHTSGIGYEHNMEKYNLAVTAGWRVLRYSPATLKKTPWKLIRDIRTMLPNDEGQTELNLDGLKQQKLNQVQVKLS